MKVLGAEERGKKGRARRAWRFVIAILVVVIAAVALWLFWPRFGAVPNVVGLSEEQGRAAIEKAGLRIGVVSTRTVDTTAAGQIVGQLPNPGMNVMLGGVVDYTIAEASGAGASSEASVSVAEGSNDASGVMVPDLVGKSESDALQALAVVGLGASTSFTQSGMPVGDVVHQAPSSGVFVEANTKVDLTISSGAGLHSNAAVGWVGAVVPEVVGLNATSARSRMTAAGYGTRLVYAPSTTTARGLCFWQSSGPGPESTPPSTVDVWISTGPPSHGEPFPMPSDISPAYSSW